MGSSRRQILALRRMRRDQLNRAFRRLGAKGNDAELAAALARIEQLNALIAGHEGVARRSQRLALVCALAVAAALIVGTAACDMPSARVDLKVTASEVQLTTTSEQRLIELLALKDLVVEGADAVEGPPELALPPRPPAFRLQAEATPIVLEPVDLPASTWVSLERVSEGRYRLRLRTPVNSTKPVPLAFSLTGTVTATVAQSPAPPSHAFPYPRQLEARVPPGATVSLTFSTTDTMLTKPVLVEQLGFERAEQVGDQRVTASALASGDLSFPDYQRGSVRLAPTERVTLAGLAGHALGIAAAGDGLVVAYSGTATTVALGEGPARRSQLPTLLDYVTGHTHWVTAGATIGALFTLLFTGWTWWREAE